jgi:hypothetical protein
MEDHVIPSACALAVLMAQSMSSVVFMTNPKKCQLVIKWAKNGHLI